MSRLFVHIGTGKTGSTAIQNYLLNHRQDLAARGVHYWGINLEHAPTAHRFPWQDQTGTGTLQRMGLAQAKSEMDQVLREALSTLELEHVAVWCNESIHERPDLYIPLLQSCQLNLGTDVSLFAYARNIRDYSLSAYKQWGVKHKTNPGQVLGFSEWVNHKRNYLSYGRKLSHWDEAFPDSFNIINYDILPDVTHDFISRLPDCAELIPKKSGNRVHASPTDAPFALYALYNNQFADPVLPNTITSLLSRYSLLNFSAKVNSLSQFYPSSKELYAATKLLESDAKLVNAMLERHGQPSLSSEDCAKSDDTISEQSISGGVISLLLRIVVEQEKRIEALERR